MVIQGQVEVLRDDSKRKLTLLPASLSKP